MKKLAVILGIIFLSTLIYGSIVKYGPKYLYHKVVLEKFDSNWFYLNDFSQKHLSGRKPEEYNLKNIENPEFWQNFHFGELLVPLPYPSNNPYFTVIPNLGYAKKNKRDKLSLSIATVTGKVLNKIFALPDVNFPDYTNEQKIFELPLIRKLIEKKGGDQIWRDVFSKPLVGEDFSLNEMFYNLYLLQFRNSFINSKIEDYYIFDGTLKGVFKVNTGDRDFSSELILEKRGGRIFTYMVMTRLDVIEAKKIRNHLIKNISFMESTPSLTDITFQEFKNLPYKAQVSPTGTLYLISAWSHGRKKEKIIEQAIDFLERGARDQHRQHSLLDKPNPDFKAPNLLQLKPLYLYYLQRYGHFYSTINVPGLELDPMIMLLKDIEKEKKIKLEEELNSPEEVKKIKKISIEQEFRNIIKKTRDSNIKSKNRVRYD